MFRFLVALALGVFALMNLAWAQTGAGLASFDVREAGVCPSVDEIEQTDGYGAYSVGRGWTFTLTRAKAFRTQLPASPLSAVSTRLFQQVTIFHASDDGTRFLVAWEDGQIRRCGWVATVDLLVPQSFDISSDFADGPRPVEVGEIYKDDPSNPLVLKAVPSNLNVKGNVDIRAYEAPDMATESDSLKVSEFYTVYKHVRMETGPSAGKLYLIGTSAGQRSELYGWVRENDVYLWNSRMAISWADTGRGRGWRSDDLSGDPILLEDLLPEPTDHAGRRFPVLEMKPTADEVQEKAKSIPQTKRTPLALSKLVGSYKVAVPTCVEKRKCLDALEVERLRVAYEERLESLKRIDILFLMDATESMNQYFVPTAAAIRSFAAKYQGTVASPSELDLRVGVSIYGDYGAGIPSPETVAYREIATFQDPRVTDRELVKLDDFASAFATQAPKDPNADKLEAPFAALIRAAQTTPWRPDAGFRMIIHLADHGNREVGAAIGVDAEQQERLGVANVVRALVDAKTLYVPIAVIGRSADRELGFLSRALAEQARQAFVDQAREIASARLKDASKKADPSALLIMSYDSAHQAESEEQRRLAVMGALDRVSSSYFAARVATEQIEKCVRAPLTPICQELPDPSATTSVNSIYASPLIVENQLGKEVFENIYSRQSTETIQYAWISPLDDAQGDPVQTIRYWAAIDKKSLPELSDLFDDLCGILKPSEADITGRIQQRLADFVENLRGPENDDYRISAGDRFNDRLHLPFWERLEILSRSWNVLRATVSRGDTSIQLDWRRKFCRTARLLRLVSNDKKINDIDLFEYDEVGTPLEAPSSLLIRYDWLVRNRRGDGLYFIPIEYFP